MTAMAEAIVNIVQTRTGASFAEFQRLLKKDGYETEGGWAIEIRPNMILWPGMSEELKEAIKEAKDENRIHWHLLGDTEAMLVYLADGRIPNFPIAKRAPKNGYKDPHWVPVVWYPGSHCSAKNCAAPKPSEQAKAPK